VPTAVETRKDQTRRGRKVFYFKLGCVASDAGVVFFSFLVGCIGVDLLHSVLSSYWPNQKLVLLARWQSYYPAHLPLIGLSALAAILTFYVFDLYPNYRKFASYAGFVALWRASIYALFIQGGVAFIYTGIQEVGRWVLALSFVAEAALFILSKAAISVFANWYSPKERALIVGHNPAKAFYFDFLRGAGNGNFPFEVAGIVCDKNEEAAFRGLPFPILGSYAELESVTAEHAANVLILTSTYAGKDGLQEFLIMAHHNHSRLVSLDSLYEEVMRKVPYQQVDKAELLNECLLANRFAQLKRKRIFDVITALTLLTLLLPTWLVVALAIKLTSRGGVFYLQERVGFRGKKFKVIKFRTMREGAENETGAVFTEKNDPRVTPVGRILRRTHLDEMPQLLNILKGDMSMVGPRPEREEFIRQIEKDIPIYALRLFTKPGFAGWAQIQQGYTSTLEELKEKFCYDLYYLKHMSIALDLKIVILQIVRSLLAKGQ
jgi:exopolysaccharide biosynthesis polyprenyl glycosylphosphotransferase